MRHYHMLLQRVQMGENDVRHIPDAENPADFLTKWLAGPKFIRSVKYLTNAAARA